ncbi:putative Flp/Fap pilin component [Tepidicaulis marinus]|jgi:pilus assembly protein Flp/PilA|uniref:Putative Flp/Fap pilin component n=1 Tax=Tepidicaulis marinus TaxID=1333998 RepID=A0A081BBC0_9HYPH|nr:Flp family type IVb pilin [Tepidicaulis marinus]GAK45338.1 putative Flp/Fap pilin component [Tepidicaulis marinus]
MSQFVTKFFKDESGATAIEYSLLAAGMAVAVIAAVGAFGDSLATFFGQIAGKLQLAE